LKLKGNPLGLIRNSSFIFAIPMALRLLFPGPPNHMEGIFIPALLLVMTFSTFEIELRIDGTDDLKCALAGFAINYLLLSGLILVRSSWLENEAMRAGFVMMATVPPAVAIIPLTKLLGGDLRIALYGETQSYGAALLLMPDIILAMAGKSGVGFWYVFKAALVTILLPLILSRFIGRR